jgi:tetratricopeptide (TPR) repeat protein
MERMIGMFDTHGGTHGANELRAMAVACLLCLLFCAAAFGADPGAAQQQAGRDQLSLDLERASRFMALRRYEDAIQILEPLRVSHPRVTAVVDMLTQCYVNAGRARDAIRLLESELVTQPERVDVLKTLGKAYLDIGETERALETWGRILSDDPRRASNFGVVARIQQDAGLYEEALETLQAGRRFDKYFNRYTMEIVRLERKLGRERAAFGHGLEYLCAGPSPGLDQAAFAVDIFRDAGTPAEMLAAVDSMASARPEHERFLRMLQALLLVEAGEYERAAELVGPPAIPLEPVTERVRAADRRLSERELYQFLTALAKMPRTRRNDGFEQFFIGSVDLFLDAYATSSYAPAVLFLGAVRRRDFARGADPPDREALVGAISLTDSILAHPRGKVYAEKALMLRAGIYMDDLHDPLRALEELDRVVWRSAQTMVAAETLRMRALIAARRWDEARQRFTRNAKHPDSTLAVLGTFGLARLYFYTGEYDEAVSASADLAEKYAWSPWANDALETAMIVKKAMTEGAGPLDCYAGALLAAEGGDFTGAVDSLGALERRYPDSSIIPRAMLRKGELLIRLHRSAEAERHLALLSERYPLNEAAPRALELLGGLLEEKRPAEAALRYEEIIERYPDDPFLGRVRNKYVALRESIDAESAPGGQSR